MKKEIYRFLSHLTYGRISRYLHKKYKFFKDNSIDGLARKIVLIHETLQNHQSFLMDWTKQFDKISHDIQNLKENHIVYNNDIVLLKNNLLQRERSIIFVHSLNFNNTGDANCAPYKYFQDYWGHLNVSLSDISNPILKHIRQDDIVIIGGGGLMNFSDDWNHKINQILDKSDNVICWGLGFNEHYNTPSVQEKIKFNKFKLIGNRDWQHPMGLPYLPCVSCMIEKLGSEYKIQREIGIVEHQDFPIPFDYDRVNNKMSLDKIIDFIGSCNVIITNGYHAMYWATLMGKKVILYKPFSSRYDHFKFKPVIYSGDLNKDIQNAKIYKDALTECRDLNQKFFDRVKQFIEKGN